jgi:CBS domain-containing protein
MTKAVCTVTPETSLGAVMDKECLSEIRCLPVVDQQGRVQGLITVFDVFKALLKLDRSGECPDREEG